MYRHLCARLRRSRLALWHSFTLIDLYSVYRRRTHPLSVPPFDLLNARSTDTERSTLKTRNLDLGASILEPFKLAQKPSFDHIKNASRNRTHLAHGLCKDFIWTAASVTMCFKSAFMSLLDVCFWLTRVFSPMRLCMHGRTLTLAQQMADISFCILPWDRCLSVWSLGITASDNYRWRRQHINTYTHLQLESVG